VTKKYVLRERERKRGRKRERKKGKDRGGACVRV